MSQAARRPTAQPQGLWTAVAWAGAGAAAGAWLGRWAYLGDARLSAVGAAYAAALAALAACSVLLLRAARAEHSAARLARRRLESSVAMQEAVFHNSRDGIVAVTRDGRIAACNRPAMQWSDRHGMRPVPVGAPIELMLPHALREPATQLLEEARRSGAVRSEFSWDNGSGPAWVQLFVHRLPEGAMAVQVRDVSRERRLQIQERKAYRDRMELENLREMDRFRMRLLNTASHELRTPITPLRLQLSLLYRRLGPHDGATRNSIAVLERNVERLALLADDLLDVAHIEGGKMALETQEVDLDTFVVRELEGYEAVAAQQQVQLSVVAASGLRVHADPVRLAQVLTNLVNNAIKHGGPGTHVRVEARRQGEEAVVEVRDDGAGFPAHKQDILFQPFSRLHDARREGSGLGLYICKGITEAHGGRIWGRSAGPGRGATFAIALPQAPRATLKGRTVQVPSHD